MNPTDPNQPVNPMAPAVDPMTPVADPMATPAPVEPVAPVADPMATPAPVEPVAPEPVVPPMGEQPVMGGMPSGDQGGQMPPTVPPVV